MHFPSQGLSIHGFGAFQIIPSPPALADMVSKMRLEVQVGELFLGTSLTSEELELYKGHIAL
jgi:hypothetical protein